MVALARQQRAEHQLRVVRRGHLVLGRDGGGGHDQQIAIVLGPADAGVESRIRLTVHQRVVLAAGAEHMPAHRITQQRHRILRHIQQRAVVRGPYHCRLRVGDEIRKQFAGGQVLHADHELPATDMILAVRQQPVVRTHLPAAHLVEVMRRGQCADIEHDFFRRIHAAGTARMDRIVRAGLEAGVVPVAVLAPGHAGVILLDAADDLLVDALLQRLQRRHHRIGPGVLSGQVREDRRILARVIAQPVVGILARAMRRRDHVRPDGRQRWRGGSGHLARRAFRRG